MPVGRVAGMTVEGVKPLEDAPWQARSAWVAAYLLTVLALVLILLSWAGVLVVVGLHVVSTWAAAPVLLVAGTGARVVLSLRTVPRPSLRSGWRRALLVSTSCAWVLVPPTAAWQLLGSPSYTVAQHAGSDRCRVVVVETSFLFAAGGTVYVAGGWSPFARRAGSYQTDDGARPVRDSGLDVTWGEGEGEVEVEGEGDRLSGHLAIDGGELSFDCR